MTDLDPDVRIWEMERLIVLAATERESLEARLAHASMHLSKLSADTTRLTEELHAARERAAADASAAAEERLRSENARRRLESLVDETNAQLDIVRQDLADALSEVVALKSTISWRVTAPLRTAKDWSKQRGGSGE